MLRPQLELIPTLRQRQNDSQGEYCQFRFNDTSLNWQDASRVDRQRNTLQERKAQELERLKLSYNMHISSKRVERDLKDFSRLNQSIYPAYPVLISNFA